MIWFGAGAACVTTGATAGAEVGAGGGVVAGEGVDSCARKPLVMRAAARSTGRSLVCIVDRKMPDCDPTLPKKVPFVKWPKCYVARKIKSRTVFHKMDGAYGTFW